MLLDARTVPRGTVLRTDVCVVGAGAAGITLARSLAIHTKLNVVLLESGGFALDKATTALYEGDVTGDPYFGLTATRLRLFGGTTNHWRGQCRPLDAIDLERRSWIPDSGWPIAREELDPFYERAHLVVQLGPYNYDVDWWNQHYATGPAQLTGATLATTMYQYASKPTKFAGNYRASVVGNPQITTVTWANVVDITAPEGGRSVDGVEVATLSGNRFRVEPLVVVVAVGGIETPRLLLNSTAHSKGLGNDNDLVGRYFTEHVHLPVGNLLLNNVRKLSPLYSPGFRPLQRAIPGQDLPRYSHIRGALTLTPEAIRRHELMHFAATLDEDDGRGVSKDSVDGTRVGVFQSDLRGGAPTAQATLFCRSEQSPNPDSRIALTGERDALGQRRVALHWKLGSDDRARLQASFDLMAQELGRTGFGRFRMQQGAGDIAHSRVKGGNHQLGTARMHRSPRKGVVDADGRVHGVSNCYVAGGAVFPTGGFTNPTLTIIALTLRLADHLGRTLA